MNSSESKNILLIDDSPEIHKLVDKHLASRGLSVLHAFGGEEGIELALSHQPNLILLDYMMPGLDGLDTLKRLKSSTALFSIPVIMITASEDQSLVTSTFDLGAVDYVRKPFNVRELLARVMATLRTQMLIAQLQTASEHDSLTGLLNLKAFNFRVNQRIGETSPAKTSSTVFYIDLDHFQSINDTLGHPMGDQMIAETARRLESALNRDCNSSDSPLRYSIARVGGDEFLVHVHRVSEADQVPQIANLLLTSLNRQYTVGNRSFHSTASLGVCHDPTGTLSAERLILQADIALSEAKSHGRRCWRLFDEGMQARFDQQVRLECDLRKACETFDFHLVYQPILRLQNQQISSVEALIRWDHPEHGVISPGVFIPIAESTGLINVIGDWCLQTAFAQFAKWKFEEPMCCPRSLNVNLARQQLLQHNFVEKIEGYARDYGIDPRCIHLEITESEIMEDLAFSIHVMNELRHVGFRIEIDDFGTGYSSLACLSQFPIDTLKLDRSLIADITTKTYSSKLVELVLKLSEQSGISVIAEGIETKEQDALLRSWGCPLGQGYLFARPMVSDTLVDFFKKSFRKNWVRNSKVFFE